MFSFARRTHTAGVGRKPRAALGLENLEWRDCPAALTSGIHAAAAGLVPAHVPAHVPAKVHVNQPPAVTSFSAEEISAGRMILTGEVSDDQAVKGLVVTFDGLAAAKGHKAVVHADGSFSVTITFKPNDYAGGRITAHTADALGLGSNSPSIYVVPTRR